MINHEGREGREGELIADTSGMNFGDCFTAEIAENAERKEIKIC